jgi:putative aldouronate transport system permease protein
MLHINLPTILPTIAIQLILRFGHIFGVGWEKILLLQNDLTKDISQVLSTYTYMIGLQGGQYSYAAAVGLVNKLINLTVLLIANRITKKLTSVGLT